MDLDINTILLSIIPILSAITIHAAADGWMAKKYGDNTAYMMGRVTLNPIPHIDLIGTILVPLLCVILKTGFIFGWAKPVPIISRNFKDVRMGIRMSTLAGPISNVLMMFIWAVLAGISHYLPESIGVPFMMMSQYGVTVNALLFAFNMLPILPLDGGRILDTFLPPSLSMKFQKIEPYGFFIVIGLAYLGLIRFFVWPIALFLMYLANFVTSLLG